MLSNKFYCCCLLILAPLAAHSRCGQSLLPTQDIHQNRLMADLHWLASKQTAGRKPGTAGHELAQAWLYERFSQLGLNTFNDSYIQHFAYTRGVKDKTGSNIVGWLQGSDFPQHFIVFTAHYDHLGKQQGKIYYGADDNASGVAGMLAIAQHLMDIKPRYSYIFIATDAEETGLHGAHAFVKAPPINLSAIKLNINLDMIAQGGRKKQLFMAGTRNDEALRKLVSGFQDFASVCLKLGHDVKSVTLKGRESAAKKTIDWPNASDHAAFSKVGISYLYFGVAEHPWYHTPQDTAQKIQPLFFSNSVQTILDVVKQLDTQDLDKLD